MQLRLCGIGRVKRGVRIEIRLVTAEDDLTAISNIYERSWKYAYRGIVPDAYLDGIPAGQWVPRLSQQGRSSLVALYDGRIAGTASFAPARMESMEGYGEVISLYVLPEAMDKGVGYELLKSAVAGLRGQGFSAVYLWVLEDNTRARRFYERFGFESSGAVRSDNIGGKVLREVQYVLREDAP